MNLLREIAVVIIFIVIWAVAFFRGMFYAFTSEMVTEEIMADGYIQGEFADFLSESYYKYYAPVAAIFREPFTGWSEEELVYKVHEKYSEQAELVENHALCERLEEAFTQHCAYELEESYYNEPDTDFMYVYDGSYEKECLIGDGGEYIYFCRNSNTRYLIMGLKFAV